MMDKGREGEKQGNRDGAETPEEWFLADESIQRETVPPLEPWLASLVTDTMRVDDNAIPRDLMWARIRQARREGLATTAEREAVMLEAVRLDALSRDASPRGFRITRTVVTRVLAIAATLAIGVAIGRYGTSSGARDGSATVASTANGGKSVARSAAGAAAAGAAAASAATEGAAAAQSNEPAVVAMEEHLARTVALLVAVRDGSPDARPAADVSGWARELLSTTRLLLDEPQLREDRTRRLLQDLELVLVQIIQARGTAAPEARRAPSETMRETNLLPRVRAAATASIATGEPSFRGIAE